MDAEAPAGGPGRAAPGAPDDAAVVAVAGVPPPGDGLDRGTDLPVPDAQLLAAHVAGDPEAFPELVRRHRDRLWAVALRTSGDPEDASDAVQEALISAYRRAASFRGDAAVSTWLHRIVVNACLDRHRARQARPQVPLQEERLTVADRTDHIAGRELHLDLAEALRTLPADQRAAIVLVDVEGHPVDEAASILGVPPGTVKSRCSRGRARLAGMLRDHDPRRPPPAPGEDGRNRTSPDGVTRSAPPLPGNAGEGGERG